MIRFVLTTTFASLCLFGCTKVYHTNPQRSATELYLLSVAVENAVRPLTGDALRGRTAFVDTTYTQEKDHHYLIASVRAKLLTGGARLTDARDKAEIIVELRTPGVSIDRSEFLIGIPDLPIGQLASAAGAPATPITTPELALVKNEKQWGTAGVAYVAYWRETGEILASSGPHIGRSYREDWSFFGIGSTVSDIPPTQPPEVHEAPELDEE